MTGWLMAAVIALGVLGAVLLGRLVLVRSDLRSIAAAFRTIVDRHSNMLIGSGSSDPAVRELIDVLNEALAVLRDRRNLYEASDRGAREEIANLAHDLRTPLTALTGYLDLLEANPDRASTYLPILRGRAELMTQVIAELFEYSLSRSGRPHRSDRPIDLRSMIESAVLALYAQFEEKGTEPELDLPDSPVIRYIDPNVTERLLGNLLANALRHGEGSVSVTLDTQGCLHVLNRAPDITPVDVQKLFNRFYTVRSGSSAGLGLGIAKSLATELGGKMNASLKGDVLDICVQFPESDTALNSEQ